QLVKRLDAAWAVGSNAGGLDTGTKANNTWYHVWVIANSTSGVVDALLSINATTPTMPSGYDKKRRIGSIKTGSSGAIRAFDQLGDEFEWVDPNVDAIEVTNPGTAAINHTL